MTVSPASRTITVTGTASSPTQITLNEAVIDPSGTGGTVSYGKNTTNTAPSDWQAGKEFSGLTADTTYYFFAKVEASGNYAEAVSAGVAISTPAKAVSSIAIAKQPTTLAYPGQEQNRYCQGRKCIGERCPGQHQPWHGDDEKYFEKFPLTACDFGF